MSVRDNLLRLHRWRLQERQDYLAGLESLMERLRADARSSASPAMVRYLAVLIRTTLTSPRQRDSAHVREWRERAPVAHQDRSSD